MSWIDIVILIIIGLSAFFGLMRGFVREVLSIVAWIAAISIAWLYSGKLAPLLSSFIESQSIRYVVAFAVLGIATLIMGGLLNHFISRLITFSGMRMSDHLLGTLFGVARGALIVMITLYFTQPFYESAPAWQQSRLVPYSLDMIEWSRGFFPAATGTASQRSFFF
jgi:membrane protein required for colicin V production